jgi:PAS domain S-box-containing protein
MTTRKPPNQSPMVENPQSPRSFVFPGEFLFSGLDSERPKTVLIVDDETAIAAAHEEILTRAGYRVALSATAEDVLSRFQKRESIDLILMDVQLGGGEDGIQAARDILLYGNVPIIFVSDRADPATYEKIKNIPCYGFIPKPADESTLLFSLNLAFRLQSLHRAWAENEYRFQQLSNRAQKAEFDLRIEKEEFEQLFRNLPHAIVIMDANNTIKTVNSAFARIFQYLPSELVGRNLHDLIVPDGQAEEADELSHITFIGEIARKTTRRKRKDGTFVPVNIIGVPIVIDGLIRAIFAIYEDITERKRYEEQLQVALAEKEVLMQELQHRVKNNLTILSSLLSHEIRQQAEEAPRQILRDTRLRIQTMASLYDQLSRTKDVLDTDLTVYIRNLAESMKGIYDTADDRIRIKFDLAPIRLDVKRAVSVGLVINELITNALKHAFRGRDIGTVTVRLAAEADKIILVVEDDGIGFPPGFKPENSSSLGWTIVKLISDQLDGRFSVSEERGVSVLLEFPR